MKDLTITILKTPDSTKEDLVKTLESLPWDSEGIDLVIISEDTNEVKKIISSEDLESTLLNGNMDVVFCQSQYSSDDTYQNIALEDTKTDLLTFLKPGDTIEYIDQNLLLDDFKLGFGSVLDTPITYSCFDSKMLPLGETGIIYDVKYLRERDLKFSLTFMPLLFNEFIGNLEWHDYGIGWRDLDISDMYSVYIKPTKDNSKIISTYEKLWNGHNVAWNGLLRDMMWNRMTRAAASCIENGKGKKDFCKYLYPDNKSGILFC